jgi:hypothetical protein
MEGIFQRNPQPCPPYEEEEVMHSVPQLQISVRTPLKREVIYAIKSMKEQKSCRFK